MCFVCTSSTSSQLRRFAATLKTISVLRVFHEHAALQRHWFDNTITYQKETPTDYLIGIELVRNTYGHNSTQRTQSNPGISEVSLCR